MNKRGIVITPQIKEIHGGIQGGPIVSQDSLRQYLVYWDEVVLINLLNPIVGLGIEVEKEENLDLRIAIDAGVFKVEEVTVRDKPLWSSAEIPEWYRIAQQDVANNYTREKEGYWSIGQSIKRLDPPKDLSVEKEVIVSSLINAMPVPSGEISIEAILEFRRKREAEFHAFRHAFDQIYLSVINSSDQQLALEIAVSELTKRIKDINKVMYEAGMNPKPLTMETMWNIITDTVTKSLVFETVFDGSGLGVFLAGGINAGFKINKAIRRQPIELPEEIKDYEYFSYIERELTK